jgi:RNA polymerase sigma-70 factor (ECF subfamily)
LSDSQVLALSRSQAESFGIVYERHARAVTRFLVRRAGTEAAEDLLGEVFAAAFAARRRVTPHDSGSALPWLYGIALNVLRTHLRKRSQAQQSVGGLSVDWDAVDARVDAQARRADLQVALADLSDGERDILLLTAWEGLTPAEAALVLGLSQTAARSRLHRARAQAQASLDTMTRSDS